MKRFIHKGFFRETVRQLRTKGLVMTFILLLLNLIELTSISVGDPIKSAVTHLHQSLMLAPTYLFLYVAVPVLTFSAYRWMNKRAQSDFYHAIPLTRLQLYGTTTAAILLWIVIPVTAHTLVRTLTYTAFGMPFNYLLQLCVYVFVLLAALTMLGAVSIGCAVSGFGFVGFFTSVVILFYPRCFITLLAMLAEVESHHAVPLSLQPFFINPAFNIAATPVHTLFYAPDLGNVFAMLYSLLYGCGLIVLGGLAFIRRKSEAADIPYSSRVLQTITRIAIGTVPLVGYASLLSLFANGEDVVGTTVALYPLGVTAVLFSLAFYCLYELISAKKWKKVALSLPFYPICLVLAAIIATVPGAIGRAQYETRVSESAVTGYRFVGKESSILIPNAVMYDKSYLDVIVEKQTFTDPEGIHAVVRNAFNGFAGRGSVFANVQYLGANQVRSQDGFREIADCMRNEAFRADYYAYPKGMITYHCDGLTLAEAKEIGRLFKADYEALTDAEKDTLMNYRRSSSRQAYNYVASSDASLTSLSITLYGCVGTKNYTEEFSITELTPNAARRYLEILNARFGEQAKEKLREIVRWMETGGNYRPDGDLIPGNFNHGIDVWNLYTDMDKGRYATPMEAHRKEYAILKSLADAPLSADVTKCITLSVPTTRNDRIGSYAFVPVGIELGDEYRADLIEWMQEGPWKDNTDSHEWIIEY